MRVTGSEDAITPVFPTVPPLPTLPQCISLPPEGRDGAEEAF